MSITFKCPECGGTVLELPDNYNDDSIATCKSCAVSFGRWGDIEAKGVDVAKAEVNRMIKEAFEGIKGFKLK